MTDVKAIADGMTDAQKKTLREMSTRFSWGEGWFDLSRAFPILVESAETRAQAISYRLTPLGLSVRAHLEGKRDAGS